MWSLGENISFESTLEFRFPPTIAHGYNENDISSEISYRIKGISNSRLFADQ